MEALPREGLWDGKKSDLFIEQILSARDFDGHCVTWSSQTFCVINIINPVLQINGANWDLVTRPPW